MGRVLFLLMLLLCKASCESIADVKNVLTKLFTTDGYNKKIRPVTDQFRVVNVTTDFFLNSVIEFDEQQEVLKTAGYLWLEWTDQNLQWDPSSYNDTSMIIIPQDDIWKPDVSLRNTYKSFTGLGSSYLNVVVNNDGSVVWKPFQILESTCSVNIRFFPFDTQDCELTFTAWSYDKNLINLDLGKKGVMLEDYSTNAQWELVETSYLEDNSYEATVTFTIELARKPNYYVINMLVPVLLLSVLNVFTFLLPVASGEKAGYAVTVFLSLAVFLTIIASELPKNSDVVSLMSVWLTLMTGLSTFIVLVCLIQIRLAARDVSETPINKLFRILIDVSLILRFKKCKRLAKSVQPDNIGDPHNEHRTVAKEDAYNWTDVVNAIDYLFFWLSLIFTFLCTTIIYGSRSK